MWKRNPFYLIFSGKIAMNTETMISRLIYIPSSIREGIPTAEEQLYFNYLF